MKIFRYIILAAAIAASLPAFAQKPVHMHHRHLETSSRPGYRPEGRASMVQSSKTYSAGIINTPYFDVNPEFQQIVEASVIVGCTDLEGSYTAGYRFNNSVFLGGGAGYNYCEDCEMSSVNVFAHAVFYLSNRRVSPMIGLKGGIIRSLTDSIQGDNIFPLIDIKPGVKIHFNSGKEMYVCLTFGPRPNVYFGDYENRIYVANGSYVFGGFSLGYVF